MKIILKNEKKGKKRKKGKEKENKEENKEKKKKWERKKKEKITSDFGGESWNWIRAILAFSIFVGPPALLITFWVKTNPEHISVSSIVPPSLLTVLISLKSTLWSFNGSITWRIASTAIGARIEEYWETTFEFNDVFALCKSESLSVKLIGYDIAVKYSIALRHAYIRPSETFVGWIPGRRKKRNWNWFFN